jgi:DNA-binding PadR family transcriptional regulator
MPLGEFELLVMLAVLRLNDEAHAAQVRDEIEARTGRPAPRGSVYITLDRLIRKGHLRERSVAGGADRAGRSRRLFAATAAGRHAAEDALAGLRQMQRGLVWRRSE